MAITTATAHTLFLDGLLLVPHLQLFPQGKSLPLHGHPVTLPLEAVFSF